MPSSGILVSAILATRTSSPRFGNSCNICVIADLSISCLVVIIACDLEETRMAWFLNNYTCYRCGEDWSDAWSCMCDDDCPRCGARHATTVDSDDLTVIIERDGSEFIVLR